eukprot:3677815-Rhodomonas_salina.1
MMLEEVDALFGKGRGEGRGYSTMDTAVRQGAQLTGKGRAELQSQAPDHVRRLGQRAGRRVQPGQPALHPDDQLAGAPRRGADPHRPRRPARRVHARAASVDVAALAPSSFTRMPQQPELTDRFSARLLRRGLGSEARAWPHCCTSSTRSAQRPLRPPAAEAVRKVLEDVKEKAMAG